ncbi:MAG: AMP-binding protein [Candidatus Tectomicrobia bacterium]|nr:AMP-binding protein [Candidatus Tectomicrobia bacterium]
MTLETLNEMFRRSVQQYRALPAFKVKREGNFQAISYSQLGTTVEEFGTGLITLGMKSGDHVGLISENCYEWILSDLAILGAGGSDVPRGGESSVDEIKYILNHSDARIAIVEDETQLKKLLQAREELPNLEAIIVMDESYADRETPSVYPFQDVVKRGREAISKGNHEFSERSSHVKKEELATIIYTSGTTGAPKGVMLSHQNIMHNIRVVPPLLNVSHNDRFLSILPPWHSYERIAEYIALYCGASTAYSKPVRQVLLADLLLIKPTFIPSVPRIWETIYNGVMANVKQQPPPRQKLFHLFVTLGEKYTEALRVIRDIDTLFHTPTQGERRAMKIKAYFLRCALALPYRLADKAVFSHIRERTGGAVRAGISGGGALPHHMDLFFQAVGLTVLEGYGLTETSPVAAVRYFGREALYTVGPPLPETEIKIIDEQGNSLPPGEKGLIMIRGPQVMRGYYKDQPMTEKVIDQEGWFNSGDLGQMTIRGEIQITGRAKDTIVLLSGENLEPGPIEDRLKLSEYVKDIMVVGQDKRSVGALIVPDFSALEEYARARNIPLENHEELIKKPEILELFRHEINKLVSREAGFKAFERVTRFVLLTHEFTVGRELTHTLKMRRNVISELYQQEIEEMFL